MSSSRAIQTTTSILAGLAIAVGVWQFAIRALGADAGPANPHDVSIPPAEAARIAYPADDSAFQEAILADGTVTEAEFESAMSAFLGCLEAEGLVVIRPGAPQLNGNPGYGYGAPKDRPDLAETADAIAEGCRSEYLSRVDYAHAAQQKPSEEEVAAYHQRVGACLDRRGIEVE